MKDILQKALKGTPQEKEAAVMQVKALSRTEDGIFDVSSIDGNIYKALGFVFPLYTEYETKVNKKEGYPDIMAQLRALQVRLDKDFTQENSAYFMSMLIDTIGVISPEIYENYRELVEMFRSSVKKAISEFGLKAGAAGAGMENKESAQILGKALEAAFHRDVLLKERYEEIQKDLLVE